MQQEAPCKAIPSSISTKAWVLFLPGRSAHLGSQSPTMRPLCFARVLCLRPLSSCPQLFYWNCPPRDVSFTLYLLSPRSQELKRSGMRKHFSGLLIEFIFSLQLCSENFITPLNRFSWQLTPTTCIMLLTFQYLFTRISFDPQSHPANSTGQGLSYYKRV